MFLVESDNKPTFFLGGGLDPTNPERLVEPKPTKPRIAGEFNQPNSVFGIQRQTQAGFFNPATQTPGFSFTHFAITSLAKWKEVPQNLQPKRALFHQCYPFCNSLGHQKTGGWGQPRRPLVLLEFQKKTPMFFYGILKKGDTQFFLEVGPKFTVNQGEVKKINK